MNDPRTLDWLLEPDQPAVRYRALTELTGLSPDHPEVREARAAIPERGWAAEILSRRSAWGGWEAEASLYTPKYASTNWNLIVLAELGIDRTHAAIPPIATIWMDRLEGTDGALGSLNLRAKGKSHYCVAANAATALLKFGYVDEPRVTRTLDWLVRTAAPLGGWSCFGSGRNLDSWEALATFAALPRARWTPASRTAVERAAEFFLQRELHQQGGAYAPWERFHFPNHYYYDVLLGLDLLTELGYGADRRLDYAIELVRRKRGKDGRWRMDAVHPDVDGPTAKWFDAHPKDRPRPFALEEAGTPSKLVTLRALRALDRVDRARSATMPAGKPRASRRPA